MLSENKGEKGGGALAAFSILFVTSTQKAFWHRRYERNYMLYMLWETVIILRISFWELDCYSMTYSGADRAGI